MAGLEQSIARLSRALDALEDGLADGALSQPIIEGDGQARIEQLEAERDRLTAEIERLQGQVEEDARLRDEAAAAVKAALVDLRALASNDTGGRHG